MTLSDWIKAATLFTQHKQEAATAETDQLSTCSALWHAHASSNEHPYRYRCTHA